MTAERYCLVADDDGHWYIVPHDRRTEFDTRMAQYYVFLGRDDYTQADQVDPTEEIWCTRIDGPHRLTFTDWEEV